MIKHLLRYYLYLHSCSYLESLDGIQYLPSLRRLKVLACHRIVFDVPMHQLTNIILFMADEIPFLKCVESIKKLVLMKNFSIGYCARGGPTRFNLIVT